MTIRTAVRDMSTGALYVYLQNAGWNAAWKDEMRREVARRTGRPYCHRDYMLGR